ncbi:copper resistance CopC family protein, partial [Ilumatobacter sp.]|uniref:copper resistance CopC family protein n=1 Tax=Ilumatobacter sp. TaxID=1967498 RepID=UPI003AF97F74
MTVPSRPLRRVRRLVGGAVVAIVATLGTADGVSAHTDFESSIPADQSAVDGPLDEVIVNFTNPAIESGSGFELLDPDGNLRAPTSVDPTDGTRFVLRFDPPLSAGTYGMRWKVQAGDAHPIEGSFQFDVAQPTTTTAAPATTSTTPAASAASTATTIAPTTTLSTTFAPIVDDSAASGGGADEIGGAAALDEFLASTSDTENGQSVGRVGRSLTFGGTIFGVGALIALAWVIRGHRDELRRMTSWIRLAGLVIATGGLIELAALQAAQSAGIATVLDSKPGIAALLKIIGGLAVWFGFHESAGQIVPPPHALSAAVATDLSGSVDPGVTTIEDHRWSPTASAGLGMTGFALVFA